MNALLSIEGVGLWQTAGWTMLHFLWLGALVGLAAVMCRVLLRRAAPNVRYAVALGALALLGALPVGIAAWLIKNSPAALPLAPTSSAPGFTGRVPVNAESTGPIIELSNRDASQPVEPATAAPVFAERYPAAADTAAGAGAGDPRTTTLTNAIAPDSLANMLARLESCVPYLPWLWLVGTPLTFLLLATGLIGSERLRRASRVINDGPIADAAARLLHTLQISRRVTVAVCERIAAPVLVGIVRPIILLPPAALTGWSPDEIEMVLLHELAHVRRWDNLVNLAQRCLESLLFFHPAVWLVSNWVRRERETCCDAVVVARTNRPHAYAEMLVALAAQMPRSVLFHPAASSAMAAGPLRARIRHILQLEEDPMLVSGKSFAMVLGSVIVAATLVVLYLPTLGQAEESASEKSATAESTTEELTTEATESTETTQTTNPVEPAADSALSIDSVMPGPATVNRYGHSPTSPTESLPLLFRLKRNETGQPVLYLNEKPIDEAGFRILFKDREKSNEDQPVSLAADEGLDFADVTRIVALFQSVGFTKLALDTRHAEARTNDGTVPIEDVWPKGVVFPSPKEGEISRRAWEKLGLKLVPATKDELKQAGTSQGVKVVGGIPIPLTTGKPMPLILVGINDTTINEFNDIGKAIDALEKKPNPILKGVLSSNHQVVEFQKVLEPKFLEIEKSYAQPADYVFASARDGEISAGAWQRLHMKLVPATPEELKAAGASHGVRVLNAFPELLIPNGKPPFILTKVNDVLLMSFDDILKVHEDLNGSPEHFIACTVMSDGTAIELKRERNEAVQPIPAEKPLNRPTATKGVAATVGSRKFPSLEDQRLADLAWKRLGIELEQISGEDLKRVQALGYEGGLKVTSTGIELQQQQQQQRQQGVRRDDILVGLHVWPTNNLKQVAEILNRDDLIELNPLKYYVVRLGEPGSGGGANGRGGFGGGGRGGEFGPEVDTVLSGRLNVQSDRTTRSRLKPTDPQPVPSRPTVAPTLSSPSASSSAPTPTAPMYVNPYDAPTPADSSVGTSQPQYVPATEPQSSVAKVLPGTPRATRAPRSEMTVVPEPAEEDETEESVLVPTRTPANGSPYQAPAHPPVPSSLSLVQDPVQPLNPAPSQPPLASAPALVFGAPTVPETRRVAEGRIIQRTPNGGVLVDPSVPPTPAPPPTPAQGKAQLRYDGKTFAEWRDLWRNELSTEKRLEAVKALAAFGRAGYGQEAIEAILDVAGEYDFRILEGDSDKEGKLKNTVLVELVPEYRSHSLAQYWVPDLAKRLEKEPKKWQWLAIFSLYRLKTDDPNVIPVLKSLAQNGPGEVRIAALGALVRSSQSRDGAPSFDDKIRELVVAALKSEDLVAVRSALGLLLYFPQSAGGIVAQEPQLVFLPELVPLLFHADEGIRKQARWTLRPIKENDAPPVVQELVAVLKDGSRNADHVEAIRALAAMGPAAKSFAPTLREILAETDADSPLRYAAAVALQNIDKATFPKVLVEVLGKELQIGLTENGQINWFSTPKSKLFQTGLDAEIKQLVPPQHPGQGGGFF